MLAKIKNDLANTAQGKEAERILRSCVHCGFCTANCPTYRLLGDERDSPRGRIYLIKSLLEGEPASGVTRTHLDRCLTCRACETFCPSGVEYGRLLEIGREQAERIEPRKLPDRIIRSFICSVFPYRYRFGFLLRAGQLLRPLLWGKLKKTIPLRVQKQSASSRKHNRKVILFSGCVQPLIEPRTNAAAVRILDRVGIEAITIKYEKCCGALNLHLADSRTARKFARDNIDFWWPFVEEGIEAIVTTASGCGVMLKEYDHLLTDEPEYQHKARKIAELCKDISELFGENEISVIRDSLQPGSSNLVFQNPCTLQHGQKHADKTEKLLASLGLKLAHANDGQICCGSAGVYSILQPGISGKLRKNKIANLEASNPDIILTANIGCQMHLQQATGIPVKHWIEVIDSLCS